MISVAPTGRIHEHTRPIFKTLLKSLASPGPSIHGAFDKPILHRLAGCDVVPLDPKLSQANMVFEVPVPLPLTIMRGHPRTSTM
jgi:hypothetical protein